jgi:hypothetical protein
MNLPDGREANCIGQIVAWFTKVSGAVVQSTLRAVPATVPETFLRQIVCTGLILALAGCGRPLAEKPGPPPRPNPPLFSMGQPNAKVRVEAFYPLDDEHKWVVTTLHDAAQTFGEKVLIRAFDIGTDWGRREWQKRGLQCGGVLINDKSCFTVDAKTVSFLRNPGDSTWTDCARGGQRLPSGGSGAEALPGERTNAAPRRGRRRDKPVHVLRRRAARANGSDARSL